jgi:F-type H+-transporting ATPase subunit delta
VTRAPRALARRYARCLLEVAGAEALALRDELRDFSLLVLDHTELRRALLDPGVGAARKRGLLAAVAERAGASPLLRRFVDLVASRDRVGLLPDVVEAYAELANASRGVVSAEVLSAVPLAEAQRRALAAALGGTVELRSRVDPDLVGGLVVRVGGTTYDGSVRTRLAALKRRLASPGPGSFGGAS